MNQGYKRLAAPVRAMLGPNARAVRPAHVRGRAQMNVPLRPNKVQTATAALILALAAYRRYYARRVTPAAGDVAGEEPAEQKAAS